MKFQEHLLGWKDSQLIVDFPQILDDEKFAASIYDRIYEGVDWKSTTPLRCFLSLEEGVVTYDVGCIETKLDLPQYLSLELTMNYPFFKNKHEEFSRDEVLEETVTFLQTKLDYLHKYLQNSGARGIHESHRYIVETNFGPTGRVSEARRESDKEYNVDLKRGPRLLRHDDPESDPLLLFYEVWNFLKPDFDGKNDSKKMRVCEKAVAVYAKEMNLKDPLSDEGQELALALYGHRKSKQAAFALTQRIVGKSRQTIERQIKKTSS